MPESKVGTTRIPYEDNDLGKTGSRRPVTRGIDMGLRHPVVGSMAAKEMSRGHSVRQGFPDSDLDSE